MALHWRLGAWVGILFQFSYWSTFINPQYLLKIYQNLKYERNFQETYDACNKNFLKVGVYFLWLFPKNWSEVVF